MRLIDADKIKYHKQLEAQGNGQYEDVEVAYKSDIDTASTVDAVSAEAVQLNQTDTLIIANALMYLINDEERHELDRATAESLREQILKYGASMCKGGDDE